MWDSAKAFTRGPIGRLIALVGIGATLVSGVQLIRDSGEPWKWLAIGMAALVLLSFWRFHETRVREPRLRLHFDPENTYDKVPITGFSGGPDGLFTHVEVVNDNGNVRARECKGRITRWEQKQASGEFKRHTFVAAPIVIKWANEEHGAIDIEPGEARRLDLVHAIQTIPNRMAFHTTKSGQGVQTRFPPGIYRAEVRASAENAREAGAWFEIDFQNWDRITVTEVVD